MTYVEFRVPPQLAGAVGHASGYDVDIGGTATHVGLPSPTLTFVLPLDAPIDVSAPREQVVRSYPSIVGGLHSAPAHIHVDGRQFGLQLALHPAAAAAVFGCAPRELAEHVFSTDDVCGREGDRLHDRIRSTDDWQGRFDAVAEWLAERLDRAGRHDQRMTRAWRMVAADGGATPVGTVADELGWSTRQLQNRFRDWFGASPKTVASLHRFDRSVALVRRPGVPLADIAARCGYADQSHLTRDWVRFAGIAPGRWRTGDPLAHVVDDEPPVHVHDDSPR